jgi:hypothetical protein
LAERCRDGQGFLAGWGFDDGCGAALGQCDQAFRKATRLAIVVNAVGHPKYGRSGLIGQNGGEGVRDLSAIGGMRKRLHRRRR